MEVRFLRGFQKKNSGGRRGRRGGGGSGGKRTRSVVCNRVIDFKRVVPILLVVDPRDDGGKGLGVCTKQGRRFTQYNKKRVWVRVRVRWGGRGGRKGSRDRRDVL